MAVQDYQMEFAGLQIGPGTPYILRRWEGYGVPDFRNSDDPAPLQDGVWTGPDYHGGRMLRIEVTARGATPEDAVANAEALFSAWYLDTEADGYGARLPLQLKMPGLSTRTAFGRPRRVVAAVERIVGCNVPCSMEFFMPDPFWYGAVSMRSFVLAEPAGGYGYDKEYDYGYGGAADSGLGICVNGGNRATWPVFTITGPVTNPRIENLTLGKTLRFQISLSPGQELTINSQDKTVILDGAASRYFTKSGDWFQLAPGANSLRFASTSYDPDAGLTVTWRDAWI